MTDRACALCGDRRRQMRSFIREAQRLERQGKSTVDVVSRIAAVKSQIADCERGGHERSLNANSRGGLSAARSKAL